MYSYERSDTETILVTQTCSIANAPFSTRSHRHFTGVQCTDSPTRPQNAISQLKRLCHPVSCLNLIASFFLRQEGKSRWMQRERRRGCIEKKHWCVNWGKAHWNQRQSEDPKPRNTSALMSLNDTVVFHLNRQVAAIHSDAASQTCKAGVCSLPEHFPSSHTGQTLSVACNVWFFNSGLSCKPPPLTSGACVGFWGRLADNNWTKGNKRDLNDY